MATVLGRLTLNNGVVILNVDQDPSAGPGTPGEIGSVALDSSTGVLYTKTGALDTQWSAVGGSGVASELTDGDGDTTIQVENNPGADSDRITMTVGDNSGDYDVSNPIFDASAPVGLLIQPAGETAGANPTPLLSLTGAFGYYEGGVARLQGGPADLAYQGPPGNAEVLGGTGYSAGNVLIQGGVPQDPDGEGGQILILASAGGSNNTAGAQVRIQGSQSSFFDQRGGNVEIFAGQGFVSQNGGDVDISAGVGAVGASGGNVFLRAGDTVGAGNQGQIVIRRVTNVTGETGILSFEENDNNPNVVGFRAPLTIPADFIWRLPPADGNASDALITDGAGNLTFGPANGITDLQGAYDNSPAFDRTIILNGAANEGVAIRDSAPSIGSSLFEVTDNGGAAEYLRVDTTGIYSDGVASINGAPFPPATYSLGVRGNAVSENEGISLTNLGTSALGMTLGTAAGTQVPGVWNSSSGVMGFGANNANVSNGGYITAEQAGHLNYFAGFFTVAGRRGNHSFHVGMEDWPSQNYGASLYLDHGGGSRFGHSEGSPFPSEPTATLEVKGMHKTQLTGTVDITGGSTTVTGTGTLFLTEVQVGQSIQVGTQNVRTVASITSDTVLDFDAVSTFNLAGAPAYVDTSSDQIFRVYDGALNEALRVTGTRQLLVNTETALGGSEYLSVLGDGHFGTDQGVTLTLEHIGSVNVGQNIGSLDFIRDSSVVGGRIQSIAEGTTGNLHAGMLFGTSNAVGAFRNSLRINNNAQLGIGQVPATTFAYNALLTVGQDTATITDGVDGVNPLNGVIVHADEQEQYVMGLQNDHGNGGYGLLIRAGRTSDDDYVLRLQESLSSDELMSVLSSGATLLGTATEITPGARLQVSGDAVISGNLHVLGTTTSIESEVVRVADNHLYLNDGYETAVAQTGGLVVNILPSGTLLNVDAPGFTAGVGGVSNPTVEYTGVGFFTPGQFIQISGSANEENDGLYELLSASPTTITIRGVGLTGTVDDFTQTQFVTDNTAQGTITPVTVSVIRAGVDGLWETGFGSTAPISFSDITTGASPTTAWLLDGNTNGAERTIGTNDAFDFVIETSGTERFRIDASTPDITIAPGVANTTTFISIGNPAFAIGSGANANGFGAGFAIGFNADSSGGGNAIALGPSSNASSTGAVAVGDSANAATANSLAAGVRATASGASAVSLGGDTDATGSQALAVGTLSQATADRAIAIGGNSTTASQDSAIAIGSTATAGHVEAVALGRDAATTADNQFMVGAPARELDTVINGTLAVSSSVGEANALLSYASLGVNGDSVEVFVGSSDPSAGLGILAPVGSLFHRDVGSGGTVGELWLKSGPLDTDWTRVTLDGGVTLQAAYENGNTIVTDALNGSFDVSGSESISLNSNGGPIGIGTDADEEDISIGTGAAERSITIGNNTDATRVDLNFGSAGAFLTGASGGLIALNAGSSATGQGGDIGLDAGDSTTQDGGTIAISAGNTQSLAGTENGGPVNINAGDGSLNDGAASSGGDITLTAGSTRAGSPGDITLTAGTSDTGTGTIFLTADDVVVSNKLTVAGLIDPTGLVLSEQSSDPASTSAGEGTIWVRDDSPNVLMFTDDDGTDWNLLDGSGASMEAIRFEVNQVGHGFSVLDALSHDGSTYIAAQADDGATLGYWLVVEVLDVDNFEVVQAGQCVCNAHGLTVGDFYFVSPTVAGALTSVEPSIVGQYSNPLVYVVDANTLNVLPFRPAEVTPDLLSATWILGGNSNGAENTLGTNDNFDLPIVTSGVERLRVNASTGFLAHSTSVGETSPVYTVTAGGANGDSFSFYSGTSNPSGLVSATASSLFFRDTGATGEIYVNTSAGSGTTWLQLGAGGGGESLAATLAIGNSTGGTNIEITNGDAIVGENAAAGGDILIGGGIGSGTTGGSVTIGAGDGQTAGGDLTLLAGDGSAGVADGGNASLQGGDGVQDGGTLVLRGGDGGAGDGGDVTLQGGTGTGPGNSGGNVTVEGGFNASDGSGGDVFIRGGAAGFSEDGGSVQISGADSASATAGSVTLQAGTGATHGTIELNTVGGSFEIASDGPLSHTLSTGEDTAVYTATANGTNGDSFSFYTGSSDPSGSVSAQASSLFFRDTGAGAELYLNISSGSGTTWSSLTPAPAGPGVSRLTFSNGDLVGGVLTFTHNLGQTHNVVQVYDNANEVVLPDTITAVDANNVDLDLSSFGVLVGNWTVVAMG